MKNISIIQNKIFTLHNLQMQINAWRVNKRTVAFTNGCFDILHNGHIYSLSQAAQEADYLVVAINSDTSVKKLKGNERPINNEQTRATIIASLILVDAVIIFSEETPKNLIETLNPDVLVKGGDYTIDQIAGADFIIKNGGRVVINKIIEGFSTSNLIEKIKSL